MGPRLSHRQHAVLLTAIERLQRCRSLDRFPAEVSAAFQALIGCDSVSYNDVYPDMQRAVTVYEPQPARFPELFQKWQQYAHQHPVVNYMRATADGSAHQLSDFLSRAQFHVLELYRECFRELQVEHQMAISVTAPREIIIGVALNRQRTRFNETERTLANLFRPHVSEAYLTLLELGHLQEKSSALAAALDDAGEGVVLWSRQGVVLHTSRPACARLERAFGWRGGRALPRALEAWAGQAMAETGAARMKVFRSPSGAISVRMSEQPRQPYVTLLVTEDPPAPDPSALRSLGLSKREAEVLGWVAAGKSNPEIAAILGLSPLTAKTHVLHLLRKLGVENRTAAAAIAHRALNKRTS